MMEKRLNRAEPNQAREPQAGLLHWEDFPVGQVRRFGSKTFDVEEIMRFAREFDPQPFHVDEAAAAGSMFGGLIASGWHTCAALMRMMCDEYLLRSASLGSPGLESIKWLQPVRPGDTLSAEMTVVDARVMQSKPHIGLVRSDYAVFNQRGEQVLAMSGWGMFRRRAG
jgi:acyl dehydratase